MKILKYYESYKNFVLYSIGNSIKPILGTTDPAWKPEPEMNDHFDECIKTKNIVFTDIHENEFSNEIHIDILIPLIDDKSIVIGIFQIQMILINFFFP